MAKQLRPPEDTVEVNCVRCNIPVTLERDALRQLIDAGESPRCGRSQKLCVLQDKDAAALEKADTRRVSRKERLLLVLHRLTITGEAVSKFKLTVEAWKAYFQVFGLPGYEGDHPHSNAVVVALTHLERDKLVERTRPNYFRPTPFGRKYAEKLPTPKGPV